MMKIVKLTKDISNFDNYKNQIEAINGDNRFSLIIGCDMATESGLAIGLLDNIAGRFLSVELIRISFDNSQPIKLNTFWNGVVKQSQLLTMNVNKKFWIERPMVSTTTQYKSASNKKGVAQFNYQTFASLVKKKSLIEFIADQIDVPYFDIIPKDIFKLFKQKGFRGDMNRKQKKYTAIKILEENWKGINNHLSTNKTKEAMDEKYSHSYKGSIEDVADAYCFMLYGGYFENDYNLAKTGTETNYWKEVMDFE